MAPSATTTAAAAIGSSRTMSLKGMGNGSRFLAQAIARVPAYVDARKECWFESGQGHQVTALSKPNEFAFLVRRSVAFFVLPVFSCPKVIPEVLSRHGFGIKEPLCL